MTAALHHLIWQSIEIGGGQSKIDCFTVPDGWVATGLSLLPPHGWWHNFVIVWFKLRLRSLNCQGFWVNCSALWVHLTSGDFHSFFFRSLTRDAYLCMIRSRDWYHPVPVWVKMTCSNQYSYWYLHSREYCRILTVILYCYNRSNGSSSMTQSSHNPMNPWDQQGSGQIYFFQEIHMHHFQFNTNILYLYNSNKLCDRNQIQVGISPQAWIRSTFPTHISCSVAVVVVGGLQCSWPHVSAFQSMNDLSGQYGYVCINDMDQNAIVHIKCAISIGKSVARCMHPYQWLSPCTALMPGDSLGAGQFCTGPASMHPSPAGQAGQAELGRLKHVRNGWGFPHLHDLWSQFCSSGTWVCLLWVGRKSPLV